MLTWFAILLPIFLYLAFYRIKILIYILIVTLTFQVSSIINIGDYSLQIYRFLTILISIFFLIEILLKMKLKLENKIVKKIILSGFVFSLFSILYSIVAPLIFEGYPVFPGELGIDFSAIYGPQPLSFTKYNLAMPLYTLFYILTLFFIITRKFSHLEIRALNLTLKISFIIIIITSLSQIIAYYWGIFDITKIFYTTVTREFEYSFIGDFLPIPRVQATYYEPSMLAPFVTGIMSFYLHKAINYGKLSNYLFLFISIILIVLSTSTTAYVSALLMFSIVILFNLPIRLRSGEILISKIKVIRYTLGIILIFLFFLFIIIFIIGLENFLNIVDIYLINKSESMSFTSRTIADMHAIKLFIDTYGLGVGLGSNRPSSLLPYLLSQVGFIGTIMFFLFIYNIIKFSYNALKNSNYFEYFFLLPSILISQLIAYPDITNPTLWQFIYIVLIASIISYRIKT